MFLEMEHGKSHQIVRASVDGRSPVVVELIERNAAAVGRVANRLVRFESPADFHRRVRQSQRQKHFLAHEAGKRIAAGALDHMVEHAIAQVAVLVVFARFGHQVAEAADRFVAHGGTIVLVGVKELIVQRQSGSVIGDAAQRGGGGVSSPGVQLGCAQIAVGRLVEIELLLFDQHHQSRGGDRLGDRGE